MSIFWKTFFILAVSFGFLFCFTQTVSAEKPDNGFSPLSYNGYTATDYSPTKVEKGFWLKLNNRQKKILRKAIRELKEQGASKKEIKALIKQYLKRWGIKPGKKIKRLKHFWKKLTEAQRKELKQAIRELKEQGASKEEIKALIKKYLEEWGIVKVK